MKTFLCRTEGSIWTIRAYRDYAMKMDCVTLNVILNQAWATWSTKICLDYTEIFTGKIPGRTLGVEGKPGFTQIPNPPTTTISCRTASPNMLTHIPTCMGHFLPLQTHLALAVPSALNVLFLKEGTVQTEDLGVEVPSVSHRPGLLLFQ